MRIIVLPSVVGYLDELVTILFEKRYFSYWDYANNYVEELLDEVYETLPTKPRKPAPSYFERYGNDMYYSTFKKSRRTIWYVFFRIYEENGEQIYQIRYIGNNHTCAKYFSTFDDYFLSWAVGVALENEDTRTELENINQKLSVANVQFSEIPRTSYTVQVYQALIELAEQKKELEKPRNPIGFLSGKK